MGNWRTVTIVGTCPAAEVQVLDDAINLTDYMTSRDKEWLPLCYGGGICGLGNWAHETIDQGGNLFERDFSVEDVVDHLRKIVKKAPGLRVKVHCGDDWESEDCIATVTVDDAGVTVGPPEVAKVNGATAAEMNANLLQQFMR